MSACNIMHVCATMKIKNCKRSCYHYCYLLIASTIIFIGALVSLQKFNMEAAAQIESNSTFTTCINGKCATTTTTCLINQPCHTVRSNLLLQVATTTIRPMVVMVTVLQPCRSPKEQSESKVSICYPYFYLCEITLPFILSITYILTSSK
jgi:hypothetical protein